MQRVKGLVALYAQLLTEMKRHEGHALDITRGDLLPMVETAAAIFASRFLDCGKLLGQLEGLNPTKHFDLLWEDVLGLNPIVLGVLNTQAATAA